VERLQALLDPCGWSPIQARPCLPAGCRIIAGAARCAGSSCAG